MKTHAAKLFILLLYGLYNPVLKASVPVITLKGKDTIYIEICKPYLPAGASASDATDGDLTDSIKITTDLDSCTIGIYTETYTVKNSGGKIASAQRIIFVKNDLTPPVIVLAGTNPYYIEAKRSNRQYIDPGVTASDNIQGNLNSSIIVTGSVNTKVLGTYYLTFFVSDVAKNKDTAVRTVVVGDSLAPEWDDTTKIVILDVFSSFVDNTTATDLFDDYPVVTTIPGSNGPVTTFAEADFPYAYNAVDASGNKAATLKRIYRVKDRMVPVLDLKTADTVYINAGQTYVPVQPEAIDNYSLPSQIIIELMSSDVNPQVPGLYTETWRATDKSGNSITKNRYVIVEPLTSLYSLMQNGLICYPNPVRNTLTLSGFKSRQEILVSVYSITGTKILQQVYRNTGESVNLPFDGFEQGIYIVNAESNGSVTTFKICKD